MFPQASRFACHLPLKHMDTFSPTASPLPVLAAAKSKLPTSARIVLKTLLSLAIAACGSHHSLAQSWTPAAPHPAAVSIHSYAFAQDGEDFYVISGCSQGTISPVRSVRTYNATTNVWRSLADIPIYAGDHPAGAFFGGKIYVAHGGDGCTAEPEVGDDFQIYDVATNLWSAGPPRPGGPERRGAAGAAFNGKFYLAGGSDGNQSTLSVYDIATNSWSAGPGVPQPFHQGGYTQIGQFLYLVGSTFFPDNSDSSMRLDMATNTWSTGPAFTPRRSGFALAAAGTRLFAVGGNIDEGNDGSAQVDELETSTWPAGVWTPSPNNLPTKRRFNSAGFFSTARAGGEIWTTGGTVLETTEHLFLPVSVPCQDYGVTQSTRALVPATTDRENNCDDCVTPIAFPFPIRFYGNSYTTANASSNGNLQFNSAVTSSGNTNLPAAGFNATIFAFWDNLRTNTAGGGIFTSVTGTAPKRVYTIEWRVSGLVGGMSNFEIQFFEGSPDFEVVYGATTGLLSGTIGVQRDATSFFTQFAGPAAPVPVAGTRLLFTTGCCAPIAFNGAIGSNSNTYPGSSGLQTARVQRDDIQSVCGTAKAYPGTVGTAQRTYDRYSFTNAGPATCVTFDINTACTGTQTIYPVAYLGSFNPANVATNYRGDPGSIPADGFSSFSVNVPANSTVVLVVHEVTAGGACGSYDVVVRGLSCPLELLSAVSRKTHGVASGALDIALPLTEQPGVECRTGGADGSHKIVFAFKSESDMTGGTALVTGGVGSAGAPIFLGPTMTVPLTGVNDMQKITLTLSGVTNSLGRVLPNTLVSMNVLLGDTSGNRSVNATDVGQTKAQSGIPVSAANFRTDTNVNGSINATDVGQVKANSGHSVP
jgi:hypothetical protein